MARTKRSAKLDSRNKRLGLPLGKRATETLAEGRYVVYYRPENGASGSWSARWRHPDTGKFGCHENWQPHVDITYYTSKRVLRSPVVMSLARLEKKS